MSKPRQRTIAIFFINNSPTWISFTPIRSFLRSGPIESGKALLIQRPKTDSTDGRIEFIMGYDSGRQHLCEDYLAFRDQMLSNPSLDGTLNKPPHFSQFLGFETYRFLGVNWP